MNVVALAWRNVKGNAVRSGLVFLCVMGVAAFFVSTTLVIRGAQDSLARGIERLGADILVVPAGAESNVETALLMGKPANAWMSAGMAEQVAAIRGVGKVSPQVYLSSLYQASCCSVSETFIVVFDPETDFTVTPWLDQNTGGTLGRDEVIGGAYIFPVPGEHYIRLYGYDVILKGNLQPTGTGIDQTIFMTMETAQDIAKSSLTTAVQPLTVPEGKVSALLVKVAPGANAHYVALSMQLNLDGVTPIESPDIFGAFRKQMTGLLWGLVLILSLGWALSTVLVGLIFSLAANERRRELGVLRALGATRAYAFGTLLAESAILALGGGVAGICLASLGVYAAKGYVAGSLGMPFLFPSIASFVGLFALVLGLSLATVWLAAMFPALRIVAQEPAAAMRE